MSQAAPARHLLPSTTVKAHEVVQAAQQVEATIEVGLNDDNKSDPGYESDTLSAASTSVTSTIFDYVYENGRRYHKFREGQYLFPNDDAEQERENLKHEMIVKLLSNKLHLAPIPTDGGKIIDLGTGTGAWCIAMGDLYPSATLLGTDLSPIQSYYVPPNVKFMVDDAESPWLNASNHFDYVHARHMSQALKNWNEVLEEAYRCLKPGGWIEFQELEHRTHSEDGSADDGYALKTFLERIEEGMGKMGVDLNASTTLASKMRDAGFVNVQERKLKIPIGTWPRNKYLKTIGSYLRAVVMDGLQGIAFGGLHRGLGWPTTEVEVFLVDVRKSLMDNRRHSFMPFRVIYGQKPES